eukprot:gene4127-8203_t
MKRCIISENIIESLNDIKESSNVALGFVDDLLMHDKIQEGILKLEVTPVAIWQLAQKTTRLFAIQFGKILRSRSRSFLRTPRTDVDHPDMLVIEVKDTGAGISK